MGYTASSFSAGQQPTTAQWNVLWANDASFNDGTGIGVGAITPEKLLTGSGTSWTPQSFTPTWTFLSPGNGTVTGKYVQIGKLIVYNLYLLWGSTTAITGAPQFTLPVTSVAVNGTAGDNIGLWKGLVAGNQWDGVIAHIDTTHAGIRAYTVGGANIKEATIGASSPDAWTTSSEFHINGFYYAA